MPDTIPEKEVYTQAVNALKLKVSGYTLTESKKTYIYEKGRKRIKDETVNKKEIGPDLSAIQFVLTNLAPNQWCHKRAGQDNYAGNDAEETPDLSRLSDAALAELSKLCPE